MELKGRLFPLNKMSWPENLGSSIFLRALLWIFLEKSLASKIRIGE
jgi:hypothetical protein